MSVSRKAPRVAVCIGRFQPLQYRHLALIESVLPDFDRVFVLCTGHGLPRDTANPWCPAERRAMLAATLNDPRCEFVPVADCWYDDARWAVAVAATVKAACRRAGLEGDEPAISCLGLEREGRDYYARLFPGWTALQPSASAPPFVPQLGESLLSPVTSDRRSLLAAHVPAAAQATLEAVLATDTGIDLLAEQAFILEYRAAWSRAPYAPIFVTVDTLALWRGQVLLVERGHRPGKGLLALPGGFLDPAESLADAARRELAEETGLVIPSSEGPATGRVFDHPLRSRRGRTLTHVFRFDLDVEESRPQVQGGDDAADARWWPLATLNPALCFEDHYAILQCLVGLP